MRRLVAPSRSAHASLRAHPRVMQPAADARMPRAQPAAPTCRATSLRPELPLCPLPTLRLSADLSVIAAFTGALVPFQPPGPAGCNDWLPGDARRGLIDGVPEVIYWPVSCAPLLLGTLGLLGDASPPRLSANSIGGLQPALAMCTRTGCPGWRAWPRWWRRETPASAPLRRVAAEAGAAAAHGACRCSEGRRPPRRCPSHAAPACGAAAPLRKIARAAADPRSH